MTRTRRSVLLLFAALTCAGLGLSAQSAPAPTPIALWPHGAPGAVGNEPQDIPTITPYMVPSSRSTGAAFVVYPGGGYRMISKHEGEPIALWLNKLGISAFVVTYRVGPRYHYPAPILDGERAVRYVRSHAAQYGIDPHKIGIIGFSAGGHLAVTVGTHFDDGNPQAADPIDRVSDRPDLMILVYALIGIDLDVPGGSSRPMLLGDHPTQAMIDLLSNEKHVTAQTPPTFMVQATDDPWVHVENCLLFAGALRQAGVPFELHLFQHGPHGFGLADGNGSPNTPRLAIWTQLAANWLKLQLSD